MTSQKLLPDFLQAVNDPLSRWSILQDMLARGNGDYYLCLGGTETSDIEGISAAGATPEGRRLTPSIDGDILVHGCPRENEMVPVSPNGIVSPVVIVRACLDLMQWQPFVIDCGTFRSPLSPSMVAGTEPARCLSSGQALSQESADALFARGLKQGREAACNGFLLIGECVPGGTTTAAALFQAFGIDGASHGSSSVQMPDRRLRQSLIQNGLDKTGLTKAAAIAKPLAAVAAVGDPMQPFVAGLALGAAGRAPVILAGGSQMLAVFYLAKLLAAARNISTRLTDIFVITTKWVAFDQSSNTRLLSEIAGAQYFAACPDFATSVHSGLRAYEDGNVKEGLGAGALMAAAYSANCLDNAALMSAIDKTYTEIVLAKNLVVN
jgi:uncharacterized protein (TIGR00303 family)